jgi:DNA-binding winged helix-turn-helix (wHTH) protein
MRTRFQQFIVDSETRQLLSDGTEVHLSPKAFDLLDILLTRRPSVVSKDELLEQIWPATYVVEANLNVLIAEVRRALGENAQAARFIRTVHSVGYAFCGTATDIRSTSRFWLVSGTQNFVLTEGENIIGRDPSCRVWLDDPDVSRRHACIYIDSVKRHALIEDLGSTNGTLLGRARIKTQTTLADGDLIRVGDTQLKFRNDSGSPQETRRIRRKGKGNSSS